MATTSLSALTATRSGGRNCRGAISSEDYTRACLDRIAAVEPKVQAFAHLDPGARARAGARERRMAPERTADRARCTAFRSASRTSSIPPIIRPSAARRLCPAAGRATMRRSSHELRAAGAVIIGKTVTTEFAYFIPARRAIRMTPSARPAAPRPARRRRSRPDMVPLALGTQTNGSIIRPARVLRRLRHEADSWPGFARRRSAALAHARSCRPVCALDRRSRAGSRCHRRL